MNTYKVTFQYDNTSSSVYTIEKDFKTLAEIQDKIYAKGCVIIGATLYMAKCIVKIEML